ncbi:hypothetical protein KKI24_08690, partial [bacterium]|nr:hypothetical protein [bacterium]
MGQHLVELFQAISIDRFDGNTDAFVDLFPPFLQQAVVGHLLDQGVLEDVLQFGKELLFVDELQPLQVEQNGFQLFVLPGDGLQDLVGETAADNGC